MLGLVDDIVRSKCIESGTRRSAAVCGRQIEEKTNTLVASYGPVRNYSGKLLSSIRTQLRLCHGELHKTVVDFGARQCSRFCWAKRRPIQIEFNGVSCFCDTRQPNAHHQVAFRSVQNTVVKVRPENRYRRDE